MSNSHPKLKKSKSKFKIFFRNKSHTPTKHTVSVAERSHKPPVDDLDYPEEYLNEVPFLTHIYETYTDVYKPIKRLSKSELESKRNIDLCVTTLNQSMKSDDSDNQLHDVSTCLSSISDLYQDHCNDMREVVKDMETLSKHTVKVMNTRADYKQSLMQHKYKKGQYETMKASDHPLPSTPGHNALSKAEDDMYYSERFMDSSFEDLMTQMQWLRKEASSKYPNTMKRMCLSYKKFFEQGLEKLKDVEDKLTLNEENDLEEPTEKRRIDQAPSNSFNSTSKKRQNPLGAPQNRNSTKIFGASLQEVMARPDETHDIPAVVKQMIDYIEEHLDVEGIFRIPASTSKMNEYIKRADLGMPLHLENEHNPHNVCGLLKKYLRMLPNSLLTHDLYDEFVDIMHVEEENRAYMVDTLFSELPKENQKLLLRILLLMQRVIEQSEENKMNRNNTIVVFAPNLLYIEDENPLRVAQSTPQVVFVTRLLMDNFESLVAYHDEASQESEELLPLETPNEQPKRKLPPPPVPKKQQNYNIPSREESTPRERNPNLPPVPKINPRYPSSHHQERRADSKQEINSDRESGNPLNSSVDSSRSRRSAYRFEKYDFNQELLSLENSSEYLSKGSNDSPESPLENVEDEPDVEAINPPSDEFASSSAEISQENEEVEDLLQFD